MAATVFIVGISIADQRGPDNCTLVNILIHISLIGPGRIGPISLGNHCATLAFTFCVLAPGGVGAVAAGPAFATMARQALALIQINAAGPPNRHALFRRY